MLYKGSCNCNRWQVGVNVTKPLGNFNPRVCDCNYCQNNPSAIISDPDMVIDFFGGEITINQNGDQLANFYYCGDLLAVGCHLNDQLRGFGFSWCGNYIVAACGSDFDIWQRIEKL